VAVRIGYDDSRSLGAKETGALAALPVFREIMLKVYEEELVGLAPKFPVGTEANIDAYLKGALHPKDAVGFVNPLGASMFVDDGIEECSAKLALPSTRRCELPGYRRDTIYPSKNESGRLIFTNE
jgi:hypothetical protein